ncbi:MAG: efflux RND transporter periplasmic adaptor subunit [Ginsengibacter sp.]
MLNKFITGIVIIGFVTSCKTKEILVEKPKGQGIARVDGYVVQKSTLHNNIDIPGTLLPYETTEIHPEVAGKVVQMTIVEGSFVSRGALLAKLFDGDLIAQIQKLRIQLQIAEKTQQRQAQLLKIGGISQQDYDLSSLSASNIRADISVLQANIAKTMIRAPFSGKLGFKNISIGAYVTPATIVTTINQVNQLKMEFSIPEKYQSFVTLGHNVSFTVEGSTNKYSGRVIATEAGITQENRSLKVRALVNATDQYLKPGAFVKANFDMGDNNSAIMIPSQAIIPGARDKKVIVAEGGKAVFKVVTTSVRDSADVQILTGLNVGDTVVTDGLLSIKPGAKIMIKKANKQKN